MQVNKSTIKNLFTILAIEILTVPVIVTYFKLIEPKKLAAIFAASTFVLTGFVILRITRKWPDAYASFVYWAVHVQIFVFAIPMLIARAIFWNKDFSEIKFLIFTGPEFHKLSEKGYLILIVCTLVDILVHSIKLKRMGNKRDAVEKKI